MKQSLLITMMSCLTFMNAKAQLAPTLVQDIQPGAIGSYPEALTVFNNKLYFSAYDPNTSDIWVHDGSTTSLATSIPGGGILTQIKTYGVANGKMYFSATRDTIDNERYLWSYTGTGNPILIDTTYRVNNYSEMVSLGDTVYFAGTNIQNGTNGLYFVDATTDSIHLAVDLGTFDINGSPVFFITEMALYNNKIYFAGTATGFIAVYGEMFVYDPATTTAIQLPSLCVGCTDRSAPGNMFAGDNGKLYFSALDTGNVRQLYEIDGNNPATQLTNLFIGVEGIWVGTAGIPEEKNLIQKGNFVYFSGAVNVPQGFELMKYDLVNNTTTLVKDILTNNGGDASPYWMTLFDNKVYFAAAGGLWSTDGTLAGTIELTDSTFLGISDIAVYNNTLYFTGATAALGDELYRLIDPSTVASVSKLSNIKVYPVPAEKEIFFELSLVKNTSLSIMLKDITGRLVYNTPMQQFNAGVVKVGIPTQQLASGVYIYTISSDKGEVIGNGRITH